MRLLRVKERSVVDKRMPHTTEAQTEVAMNTSASHYVRVFTSSSRARR